MNIFGFQLDPVTLAFSGGIISLCILFIIIDQVNHLRIRSSLRRNKKNFDEENLKNHGLLAQNWHNYASTFFKVKDENRTDKDAYQYFTSSIAYSNVVLGQLKLSIPNVLVGLGILGTFTGLVFGISDFDTSSTEAIRGSISSLLGGISIAFITSLVGMGTSIFYTIYDRILLGRTMPAIAAFNNYLNKRYLLNRDELFKWEQEAQYELTREIIAEFFLTQKEGRAIFPKDLLLGLAEESQKQTSALQSFADDLAEKINAATAVIIEQYNSQINELLAGKILPLLEALKRVMQETSTKAIEDSINKLEAALKNLVSEFKDSLSGDTKNELEKLAETLARVGGNLNDFPTNLSATTSQLNATVQSQGYNVELLRELFEEFKSTLEENRNSQSAGKALFETIQTIQRELQGLSGNFNQTARSFESTSHTLQNTSDQLGSNLEEFSRKSQSNLETVNELLEISGSLMHDYTEKFAAIEEGLSSIFSEIQEGLRGYQETTRTSLEEYLGQFAGKLTEAQKALAANIEGLQDVAEEISEQLDKMPGIRT